jgi:hypothetical protein
LFGPQPTIPPRIRREKTKKPVFERIRRIIVLNRRAESETTIRGWRGAALSVVVTAAFYVIVWSLIELVGIADPLFPVCVLFLTMGWSTLLNDIWQPALRSSWFDPKPFERGGQLYRALGVRIFQSLLRRIGWERIMRDGGARFGRKPSLASRWEHKSRLSEFAHMLGILALLPILVWMIVARERLAIVYLVFWTLPLHVYPIMLQRYNRPRYQRVVDRERKERTTTAST